MGLAGWQKRCQEQYTNHDGTKLQNQREAWLHLPSLVFDFDLARISRLQPCEPIFKECMAPLSKISPEKPFSVDRMVAHSH